MHVLYQSSWLMWTILFLALIGAWVVLRFLLRLTFRIFFIGCSTLAVLALILFLLRWFHGG